MSTIKSAGFTLIELLLTIVVMGIVTVVVGEILIQGYGTFTTAQEISNSDWEGLLVLESFTNDVHRIRSAADITTITSGTFSFVDVDGSTVSYTLSGTTLTRTGTTLATGITSLAFTYLDKNGTATATASNTRYVTITITVTKGDLAQIYSTLVGTRGMA